MASYVGFARLLLASRVGLSDFCDKVPQLQSKAKTCSGLYH